MAVATLKLNIANPSTGRQLKLDLEDEKQKRIFYEKRLSQEVEGDALGENWKGYIFKILGGNDKEGFPMMQGVLQPKRVRLLLDKNSKCYRQRRTGERKRKSIRGCIVGPDISVLHLVVAKKGAADVPGLCDKAIPRRLGPKRASKIRKLFNLSKADDVRQYVIRREIAKEGKKKKQFKAPKIQRLVTPQVLQRKRSRFAEKKKASAKAKQEKADYHKLLAQRNKQKRAALISKKRSESTKGSVKDVAAAKTADPKKGKTATPVAAKGKVAATGKAAAKTAAKATTKAPAAAKGGKAPATTKAATTPAVAKGGKAPAKTAAAPAKGKSPAAKKPAATGKPAAGKGTKKA